MPLYNESENVDLLYSAIVDSLKDFPEDYEIIFIYDGSSDNTREVALDLANSDRRLKLVIFRKNFGQTPAMAAGVVDTLWTLEDLYDAVMGLEERQKRAERYERLMRRLRGE